MRRLWKHLVLASLIAGFSLAAAAQTKRALIVGVGDYSEASNASGIGDLEKTVGDAEAYADRFEALGWTVDRDRFVLLNPTLEQFDAALNTFVSEIGPGDEVAFVYSGHGWSFARENFITFTDTVFDPNGTATNETSFGIGGQVLPRLGLKSRIPQQRPRIVISIIDACREAPFGGGGPVGLMNFGGGGTMGVQPVKGPRGSVVIYSAGEGEFASETLGPGDDNPNSAFSRFMLEALQDGDRPIYDVFRDVRVDVFNEAKRYSRVQTPAVYDEFVDAYCLSGECVADTDPPSDRPAYPTPSVEFADDQCGPAVATLYFGLDQMTPTAGSISVLESALMRSANCELVSLKVEGHEDLALTREYAIGLSQRRADQVAGLIVTEYGVDPLRLVATGLGDTQPIVQAERSPWNRRAVVTITFLDPDAGATPAD